MAGNAAGGPEKQLKRDPHNPEERGSPMLPPAAGPPPLLRAPRKERREDADGLGLGAPALPG